MKGKTKAYVVSKNRGKANEKETAVESNGVNGGKGESQGVHRKKNQPPAVSDSDGIDNDESEIKEVIVDEEMHGTSLDLPNFIPELF